MMAMIVVPPFHQRCPLQATRFRPTQRHMIIEPQMPQISHANPEYRDHTPASSPLDIGDADFVVTSAVLDVMDDNITFTATGTNAVTYTITSDVDVSITEADGDVLVLRTTLSNNAMRLRFVDDDGNIFDFDKR